MKTSFFSSIGLAFFVVLAAAAPAEQDSSAPIEARGEQGALHRYGGTCDPVKKTCRYTGPNGRTAFCRCSNTCFNNKKGCYYESADRSCKCGV